MHISLDIKICTKYLFSKWPGYPEMFGNIKISYGNLRYQKQWSQKCSISSVNTLYLHYILVAFLLLNISNFPLLRQVEMIGEIKIVSRSMDLMLKSMIDNWNFRILGFSSKGAETPTGSAVSSKSLCPIGS